MKRTMPKRRERAQGAKSKPQTSHGHYKRGTRLEARDAAAARAAYEACLEGDCTHLEARINLGRLLHADGLLKEAEALYRDTDHGNPILYFNLGVVLEDLEREMEAIEAYRESLLHDPGMADAHFNLSLIHSRRGEAQPAFRHLLAYRRLILVST
jgi:tetratricopeptide (TPR) repeat protein